MKKIFYAIVIVFIIGVVIKYVAGSGLEEQTAKVQLHNSILHIEMNGVILNGKKFLKNFKRYSLDPNIKAIIVEINSPGGAVGPSQEIYTELKKFRDADNSKPIVCVSSNLIASGSYYAAMGCDKIIVAPGALIGSIGVIMNFANLQGLYDWAKVSRFTIQSGAYKDSGAEYRPMRADEKELFQNMINEVYGQFRAVVAKERKLSDASLDAYANGRVFTGETAVKEGYADQVGYFEDAVKMAAEMAKLGNQYTVFEIPKKKMSIFDFGEEGEEDTINSLSESKNILSNKFKGFDMQAVVKAALRTQYLNQPLLLMPGFWE